MDSMSEVYLSGFERFEGIDSSIRIPSASASTRVDPLCQVKRGGKDAEVGPTVSTYRIPESVSPRAQQESLVY